MHSASRIFVGLSLVPLDFVYILPRRLSLGESLQKISAKLEKIFPPEFCVDDFPRNSCKSFPQRISCDMEKTAQNINASSTEHMRSCTASAVRARKEHNGCGMKCMRTVDKLVCTHLTHHDRPHAYTHARTCICAHTHAHMHACMLIHACMQP